MATELMQSEKFDLDAWRNLGETRLEAIDQEMAELTGEMKELQVRMDDLAHEKDEIKKALGYPSTREKANGHNGKVMIRPVLLSKLIQHQGMALEVDGLVNYVKAEKPEASTESIKTSLLRLIRAHDDVHETEEGRVIYSPPSKDA